jgi:hypothetical protein
MELCRNPRSPHQPEMAELNVLSSLSCASASPPSAELEMWPRARTFCWGFQPLHRGELTELLAGWSTPAPSEAEVRGWRPAGGVMFSHTTISPVW